MGFYLKFGSFILLLLALSLSSLRAQNYHYPFLESAYDELALEDLFGAIDLASDNDKAIIYYCIAEQYLIINSDSCLFYCDLATDLLNRQDRLDLHTPLLLLRAMHAEVAGELTTALSFFMKAVEYANLYHRDSELGFIYFRLGYLYRVSGNYDLALKALSKSLIYLELTNHPILIARCRLMMVKTFYDIEQYETAIALLNSVDEVIVTMRDSAMIYLYSSHSLKYYVFSFNKLEKTCLQDSCLSLLEVLYEDCKRSSYRSHLVLRDLSDCYLRVGQYDRAIIGYNLDLDLLDPGCDLKYRASILTRRAHAQELSGDFHSELKSNKEALKIRTLIGDSTGCLNSLLSIANSFVNLKIYDSVLGYVDAAYDYAYRERMLLQLVTCCSIYSRLGEARGDYQYALEWYKKSSIYDKEQVKAGFSEHLSFHHFDYTIDLKLEHVDDLQARNDRNQLLMIILVVLIILITLFFYLVQLYRKNRIREDNVRLKQNLLTAQMNPHFIFNSLVAIQNYIYKNDTLEAVRYLSSFSNMIRQFLNNSRTDYITLLVAIETTQYYIDLQSLRFSNAFDFSMNIDPSLRCESTLLPPGLVQPFVENSIEHGLPSDKRGQITIGIWQDHDRLCIEILDNGIGISQSIKSKKTQSHQSLARVITAERFQLFNTKHGKKVYSFNITDRVKVDGTVVGTRVFMELPLLLDQSKNDLDKSDQ